MNTNQTLLCCGGLTLGLSLWGSKAVMCFPGDACIKTENA